MSGEVFFGRMYPNAYQKLTAKETLGAFMHDWGYPELAFERRQHLVRGWTAPNTREGQEIRAAEYLAADQILSDIFMNLRVPFRGWSKKLDIVMINTKFLTETFGAPGSLV